MSFTALIIDRVPPHKPNTIINKWNKLYFTSTSPLNYIWYITTGKINPRIVPVRAPVKFRKSVKLGMTRETPVITHIINVRATTLLALRMHLVRPVLKN
jgi:hypothetical protein